MTVEPSIGSEFGTQNAKSSAANQVGVDEAGALSRRRGHRPICVSRYCTLSTSLPVSPAKPPTCSQ
jgi:hypothetical protein